MLQNFVMNMWLRLTGIHKDCQGFVVMSTLAIFLFLFVLCSSIYAIGETIHQRVKIQNACDAAAYSAAIVQADGLSRMATVNRAMAWSYVQMTNRQMDYVAYRWLKLTHQRFQEDKDNAKAYAAQLILAVDKEIGWWALAEAAVSGAFNVIFDKKCSTGNHSKEHEGMTWWCGLEAGTKHEISINQKNSLGSTFSSVSDGIATNYLSQKLFTHDNLSSILKVLSFIDKEKNSKNAEDWGHRLGILIDFDKKNIRRMNQALERINIQTEISMKMTAESVVKAMLKDNRLDPASVLKDYYISIHIPHAENPYQTGEAGEDAESFFSPLHNTEADEMLFLNMQNADYASRTLLQHFPTFPAMNLGNGLDQWFIRGCGIYADNKVHDSDSVPLNVELTGTKRNEGALGIQRVYKDTNLNEGRVGFFSKTRQSKGNQSVVSDAKVVVSRGNHLFSLMDWVNAGFGAAKDFFTGGGSGDEIGQEEDEEDVPGEISVDSSEDYEKAIQNLKNRNAELQNELNSLQNQYNAATTQEERQRLEAQMQQIRGQIADNEKNIADLQSDYDDLSSDSDNGSGGSSGSGSGSGSGGDFFGDLISGVISSLVDSLIGDFLDIDPSCDSIHGDYRAIPMCTHANETTALYSEYRWASCKYFCLTKFWTWSLCLIAGKDIYCDRKKKTIINRGIYRLRGRGYGHYGIPKMFCGASPTCAVDGFADFLFEYFPPLYGDITGTCHGYMKSVWNMGSEGFLKPIMPLLKFKETSFSRDEYRSCAMFPDGTFRFAKGSDSHAGLIRGHARIYADDREIFDNRYVGAVCKPWVLNEKFFAGEGSIVVGAAMKHTNPFVQLFGFLSQDKRSSGNGERSGNKDDKTVLSAFNIPGSNYMWTMSAARAGVRHRRRNGEFDGARQYQITYDSSSDVENLYYSKGPYVRSNDGKKWVYPDNWDSEDEENSGKALSRIYFQGQTISPIWNGCPCGRNTKKFKNIWNLCETDWDATLLPLRYAGQRAQLYLSNLPEDKTDERNAFSAQDYTSRLLLIDEYANNLGKGECWIWDGVAINKSYRLLSNPFLNCLWNKADSSFFFDNGIMNAIPGVMANGISNPDGLNLQNKIPTGKKEKTIDILSLLKDKLL